MRFITLFYRSLCLRPSDQIIFGKLNLSHHAPTGASAFVSDPVTSGGGFYLRYGSADGVTLSDEPQLLAVNLVCSSGPPALTGRYVIEMLTQADFLFAEGYFVASRRRSLPCLARPT